MWIVALAGELVTSESIMQSSEFLFKNAPYGQSISDYSLAISSDHPAYIVFYDEFFVEDIANMEFTPTIGWVELYNDNGTIAVGNSAYMLAGGSLYVGGGEVIPEPSSGMLILFGAALLALKRRQMKTLNPVNPVNTVSKTKT